MSDDYVHGHKVYPDPNRPDDKFGADVIPWRGHRDKNREWPTKLWTGTRNSYPWVPDNVTDRTRQHYYRQDNGGF